MGKDKSGRMLLLTILSGAELLGLLYVLFIRLSEIRHAVEKVQNSVVHIMWGVRAIETQTAPLSEQRLLLHRHLIDLADNVEGVASQLATDEQRLAPPRGR